MAITPLMEPLYFSHVLKTINFLSETEAKTMSMSNRTEKKKDQRYDDSHNLFSPLMSLASISFSQTLYPIE